MKHNIRTGLIEIRANMNYSPYSTTQFANP